jgi:hypothetical protein
MSSAYRLLSAHLLRHIIGMRISGAKNTAGVLARNMSSVSWTISATPLLEEPIGIRSPSIIVLLVKFSTPAARHQGKCIGSAMRCSKDILALLARNEACVARQVG